MRIKMMFVALLAVGLMAACGGKKADKGTTGGGGGGGAEKSLYDRLGGKDNITKVVEKFVGHVVADDRIKAFFTNADPKRLKAMLVDQICAATGGPCKYTGKDMKTAHTGMGVKEADFNALVDDLIKTLKEFNVPQKEQDELIGALGGMKGDIVAPAP
jgi:hemoglobin